MKLQIRQICVDICMFDIICIRIQENKRPWNWAVSKKKEKYVHNQFEQKVLLNLDNKRQILLIKSQFIGVKNYF